MPNNLFNAPVKLLTAFEASGMKVKPNVCIWIANCCMLRCASTVELVNASPGPLIVFSCSFLISCPLRISIAAASPSSFVCIPTWTPNDPKSAANGKAFVLSCFKVFKNPPDSPLAAWFNVPKSFPNVIAPSILALLVPTKPVTLSFKACAMPGYCLEIAAIFSECFSISAMALASPDAFTFSMCERYISSLICASCSFFKPSLLAPVSLLSSSSSKAYLLAPTASCSMLLPCARPNLVWRAI